MAMILDSAGNVYVTGTSLHSGTGEDYATVKYSAEGTEFWASRYDTLPVSFAVATGFAGDSAGNAYITGYIAPSFEPSRLTYVTLKYDPTGARQWSARLDDGVRRDNPGALAVDTQGNVYLTGNVTVKYNSSGALQWTAPFEADITDRGSALGVDNSGNVYVTGQKWWGPDSARLDYTTVKYSAIGEERWVRRYNGPDHYNDEASDLCVDALGNVYVTGKSMTGTSGSGDHIVTVKYDADGIEQWVARYSRNPYTRARAIAIDDSSNVYITGESNGNFVTLKYNWDGNLLWSADYNGSHNGVEVALAIDVDNRGSVYVTGQSGVDYATVKYRNDGVEEWAARNAGPGGAHDLVIDQFGNAYVTGSSNGDIVTIKYSAGGAAQWVARYDGPHGGSDSPVGIFVDRVGNAYVGGTSASSRGNTYTIIKYSQEDPVAVHESDVNRALNYRLMQNYPNPFNPTTRIGFQLPMPAHVILKIFDLRGRELAALVNETKPAGLHVAQWTPTNLSSGVYVYRLEAGGFVATRKLILLK
jgi:hypothetical protein